MAATRLRVEPEAADLPDSALVEAAAAGDGSAFAELYRRHVAPARRAARGVAASEDDADDAVAEAFTRVFDAIAAGRARRFEFRPYVLTAARNAAVDQVRRGHRLAPVGDMAENDRPAAGDGPPDRLVVGLDATLVSEAFQGLPARWQSVLWLTEVEGVPAREAAEVLGLSANNVSQLAVRARARLRERYFQAHVRNHADPRCQDTVERLGGYVAGTLPAGQRAQVDDHLEGCAECRARITEVEDLGVAIRRALGPAPALALALSRLRHRRHRRRRDVAKGAAARTADLVRPGSAPVSALGPLVAAGPAIRLVARSLALAVAFATGPAGAPGHSDPAVSVMASPPPTVAPGPEPTTTVAPAPTPAPPPAPEAPAEPPWSPGPLPTTSHPHTVVATALGPSVGVHGSAGLDDAPRELANPQPSGAPLVFVVIEETPIALHVLLPTRPNGSTGWVPREQVELSEHDWSIVVERRAHRITVFSRTDVFLSAPIGVGTKDTPTPGGLYYTKELIQPVDASGRLNPRGPYGPYAYGLSGFSDVLAHFAGGDGVIGIHGTNDPSALGHDVSHGCIRVSNPVITNLAETLPLAVPVEIRA